MTDVSGYVAGMNRQPVVVFDVASVAFDAGMLPCIGGIRAGLAMSDSAARNGILRPANKQEPCQSGSVDLI